MSHDPVHYTLQVANPSALAAYPSSFDDSDSAYVESLKHSFVYSRTSVATVDNETVINGPGSVGRWLRGALTVPYFLPSGAGIDDAVPARALELERAYQDPVSYGTGVFEPSTPQYIPAGTRILLGGSAFILSSIPAGTQMNAPFFGNMQLGIGTALAVTALKGTRVVTLTDASYISLMPVTVQGTAPPIINLKGDLSTPFPLRVEVVTPGNFGVWTGRYQVDGHTWVAFTSAATVALTGIGTGAIMEIQPVAASADNVWTASRRSRVLFYPGGPTSLTKEVASYSVQSITGVTLTLTRPLLRTWRIGGDQIAIYPLTGVNDLLIDNEGGSCVVGTGDRAFEVVAAERAVLRNVYASGHFVDVTCGIDLANNLAFVDGAYVAGNSSGLSCYSMESSEDIVMERLYGHDSNSGLVIPETDHGAIAHCAFWSCVNGWVANANDVDASEGCRNFLSFNTRTALCTYGCKIGDDARDTFVLGGNSDLGVFGLRQDASGVTGRVANYTAIVGWSARENSQFGISHENGTAGNMGACVHLAENAAGALSLADGSTQTLVSSEFEDHGACGAAPLIHVASASELRLSTSRIVSLGGLGSPGFEVASGGAQYLDGITCIGVAKNGPCFLNNSGILHLSRIRTAGPWPTGIYTVPGQQTYIGSDVDLTACGVVFPSVLQASGIFSAGVAGGTALTLGAADFTIELTAFLPAQAGAFGTGNALGGMHDLSALGSAASFAAVNNDLVLYYNAGGIYPNITLADFWTRRTARYVMLHALFTGGNRIRIFADGVLVSDTALAYNLTTAAHATIGLLDNFALGVTSAQYQQLKVWNRALTPAEITARFNWNDDLAAMRVGLAGEYKMAEGSGTTVADGSGNGRPLALTSVMNWAGTPWVSPVINQDGAYTAVLASDIATVDMQGIGAEATPAQWRCQVQRLTGALTGDVPYYLPKLKGAIWTIDQRTTGGHNAVAGGVNGATVACAAGVTRVMCDGTDFSVA